MASRASQALAFVALLAGASATRHLLQPQLPSLLPQALQGWIPSAVGGLLPGGSSGGSSTGPAANSGLSGLTNGVSSLLTQQASPAAQAPTSAPAASLPTMVPGSAGPTAAAPTALQPATAPAATTPTSQQPGALVVSTPGGGTVTVNPGGRRHLSQWASFLNQALHGGATSSGGPLTGAAGLTTVTYMPQQQQQQQQPVVYYQQAAPTAQPQASAPAAYAPAQTPAATPAPAPTGGAPAPHLGGEDPLALHNQYRAYHHAPALSWDTNLQSKAQSWANKLASECAFYHSGSGENLASGFTSWNAVVWAWYNEYRSYSYGTPGFSEATGHFTQLVWVGTQRLGCAYAKANCWEGLVWACEYDPPGNVNAPQYFQANVLAP